MSDSVQDSPIFEYTEKIRTCDLNSTGRTWIEAALNIIYKQEIINFEYIEELNDALIEGVEKNLQKIQYKTGPRNKYLKNHYKKVLKDLHRGLNTELHTVYDSERVLLPEERDRDENLRCKSERYEFCDDYSNIVYQTTKIELYKEYSIVEVGMPLNYC